MQKKLNASSRFLSVVSQVIFICRQHTSSLITASSSLISKSHFSRSDFEFISLPCNSLNHGSMVSHLSTVRSTGKKCLSIFLISADAVIYSLSQILLQKERDLYVCN